MFAAVAVGILLGYPVAFTLAGSGVLFALVGSATGHFDLGLYGALSTRVFAIITNEVLVAIPLFVLMGVTLERSRIAEELLEEMAKVLGALRGGLAVSVTLVGGLLAASTGIVGATVVTMALISLPTMLRHGYPTALAAGTVASAGTLGQIIPPSTMLIILGEVMSAAYQQAQFAAGQFSIQTVSVGQLFAGAMVPGLVLVGLYCGYLLLVTRHSVALARAEPPTWRRLLRVLVPPVVLIVAVLGSILGGVATPTEAASVGAVVALFLAALRRDVAGKGWILAGAVALGWLLVMAGVLDLRLGRSEPSGVEQVGIAVATVLVALVALGLAISVRHLARHGLLGEILTTTTKITTMIFTLIVGASVFSLTFYGFGGDERVYEFLNTIPGGELSAFLFVMVLVFLLGFVLDFVEICVIVIPVVAPVLLQMGMDPVWLAVMIALNLQTSFLTPPFGYSLFYLRSAAPAEVSTWAIYRGVVPFVAIQLGVIGLVYGVPVLATWLPGALFG
ncbi:MAG: TRAP transporter large permease subunit [Candidatus Competibacterales bacterium]